MTEVMREEIQNSSDDFKDLTDSFKIEICKLKI